MFTRKAADAIVATGLIFLFLFLCARAALVDITHDEAYSFLNIKHFWYVQFLCNANSHWINSLGMKLASIAELENCWQVRWLSLLSAGVIMWLGFQWLRQIEQTAVKFLAFSFVFLNPFVLDYFFMARGYVSGMAFEALAIFFFVKHFKYADRRFALLSLVCAGLSAVANFNFFYFLLAFCAVYFFMIYFKKGLSVLRQKTIYADALIALAFILLVLRALFFIRQCSNDFGFGGEKFISSIWGSYVDGLMYLKINPESRPEFYSAVACFIIYITTLICGLLSFKRTEDTLYFASSVISVLILFMLLFNHFAFHVMYPNYRTALVLFPLAGINLAGFFTHVRTSRIVNMIVYAAAGFFLANFISAVNFKYTFDFYHQCESKEAFKKAESLGAKKVGLAPEHYGVFINYYQATDKYKFNFYGERINTYDPRPGWDEHTRLEEFDYLILYPPYNLSFYKNRPVKFECVIVYPVTKTIILKVINTKRLSVRVVSA